MYRMRHERLARGLSQAELARRSGLNASTICQAEAGRFRLYPSQLGKLAQALGVPADQAETLLSEVAPDGPNAA